MDEEMLTYQTCPYMAYPQPTCYPYRNYPMPYGWDEEDERNDGSCKYKPKPVYPKPVYPKPVPPMPMPMPVYPKPVQPIIFPIENKSTEFKSLQQNVNVTEINNTIIQIEQKRPDIIRRLLMLGLAYAECKKILFFLLLASGKFDR